MKARVERIIHDGKHLFFVEVEMPKGESHDPMTGQEKPAGTGWYRVCKALGKDEAELIVKAFEGEIL